MKPAKAQVVSLGYTIQQKIDMLPLKVFVKCDKCGNAYTGYVVKKYAEEKSRIIAAMGKYQISSSNLENYDTIS